MLRPKFSGGPRAQPSFSPEGLRAHLPARIRHLDFNQLRSQLYPMHPELAAQAIVDGAGPRVGAYLPQRMLFNKWKSPRMGYAQNASSFVDAVRQSQDRERGLAHIDVETPSFADMGQRFFDLPGIERAQNLRPDFVPLSRQVIPLDRVTLASRMREEAENIEAELMVRSTRRDTAIDEIVRTSEGRQAMLVAATPSQQPVVQRQLLQQAIDGYKEDLLYNKSRPWVVR
jgi:hypothetical protein